MFAVFVVRYFVRGGHKSWDTSATAAPRWSLLVPWLLGFVAYQLVNPGTIGWWARDWGHIQSWLHFTPQSWMSASVLSFAVAFVATLLIPVRRQP
jgi:hypothetical protein